MDRLIHPMLGDLTFYRDCYEAERAYWAERGLQWPECLKNRVQPKPVDTGLPPSMFGRE